VLQVGSWSLSKESLCLSYTSRSEVSIDLRRFEYLLLFSLQPVEADENETGISQVGTVAVIAL